MISNAIHAFSNIFPDDEGGEGDSDGDSGNNDGSSSNMDDTHDLNTSCHDMNKVNVESLPFRSRPSSSSSAKGMGEEMDEDYSIQFFMGSKKLDHKSIVYQVIAATDMEKEYTLRSLDTIPYDKMMGLRKKRSSWSTAYRISFRIAPGGDARASSTTVAPTYDVENENVLLQNFLNKVHDPSLAHLQEASCYIQSAKRLFGVLSSDGFQPSKSYALLLLVYFHFVLEYGHQFVRSLDMKASSISLVNTILTTKSLFMSQGPMASTGSIVPDWLRWSLKNMPFFYSFSAKAEFYRSHYLGIARTLTVI